MNPGILINWKLDLKWNLLSELESAVIIIKVQCMTEYTSKTLKVWYLQGSGC